MKITIFFLIITLFLASGCKSDKKEPPLSKAEEAKQRELRIEIASEFYLKDYITLGGMKVKPDEKSFKEAKRRVLLTEAPTLSPSKTALAIMRISSS